MFSVKTYKILLKNTSEERIKLELHIVKTFLILSGLIGLKDAM